MDFCVLPAIASSIASVMHTRCYLYHAAIPHGIMWILITFLWEGEQE